MNRQRQVIPFARGFTLIEVMVAMAVVAVALPALLFTLFQQLDGTAYMRDRTLANWVATNKMSEVRLAVATTGALPRGEFEGESDFAERSWLWRIEQQETQLPGFVRVAVIVSLPDEPDAPLHTLVAFMAPEDQP